MLYWMHELVGISGNECVDIVTVSHRVLGTYLRRVNFCVSQTVHSRRQLTG